MSRIVIGFGIDGGKGLCLDGMGEVVWTNRPTIESRFRAFSDGRIPREMFLDLNLDYAYDGERLADQASDGPRLSADLVAWAIKLTENVERVVPYVCATLPRGCDGHPASTAEGWGSAHMGRSVSSRRQLEALREEAAEVRAAFVERFYAEGADEGAVSGR